MTHVSIRKTSDGSYRGFTCIGHSGYAEAGEDIVCAAISVLVINTVNSLELLAGEQPVLVTDEKEGLIDCRLDSGCNEKAALLLDSMILGLQEIRRQYGKTYLNLTFEEV
jgi:hypothetical protein